MDKFEEQYQKNKSKVVIGRKTAQELITAIKSFLDIELVPLTILPKSVLNKLQYNIQHHYYEVENPGEKTWEYKLYIVTKNDKSKEFYHDYSLIYKKIFILFEMRTGQFQTNCDQLRNDLGILRGLSKSNLVGRTMAFKEYVTFFYDFND